MTVLVVENKPALKKRVERFFDPSSSRGEVVNFIECLVGGGLNVYIFGGAIRDIALGGVRKFEGDIDIVFSVRKEGDYLKYLKGGCVNKFGGYRLNVDGWQLDLWELDKTWAFKEGFVVCKGVSSLLETTITSWDAIYYDWRRGAVVCSDYYFDDLRAGRMDLVLKENPNSDGAVVRILRGYIKKSGARLSNRLSLYVRDQLASVSPERLMDFESKNYNGDCVLSRWNIDALRVYFSGISPDIFDIELEEFYKTKGLFE